MRKKLAVISFMLMVILGLGAATAASSLSIDNKYLDQNGKEISSTQVGNEIIYGIDVTNNGDTAAQDVTQKNSDKTTSNIDWEAQKPVVSQGTIVKWETSDNWYWDIGTLQPGVTATLLQKCIPLSAGSEIYYEDVWEGDTLVDTSAAAFVVTSPSKNNAHAKTVGMQTTGSPIAPLALALLMMIGGLTTAIRKK